MASVGKFLKQNTSLVHSKSLHVRVSHAGFSASFQQLNYIIRKTDAEVMTCQPPQCSPYDTTGLVYAIGRCIPNAIPVTTSLVTFCTKFEFFFSTGGPVLAKTMAFELEMELNEISEAITVKQNWDVCGFLGSFSS